MKLIIKRDYLPNTPYGALFYGNEFICYTIEPPLSKNQPCLKEKVYKLVIPTRRTMPDCKPVEDIRGIRQIALKLAPGPQPKDDLIIGLVSAVDGFRSNWLSRAAMKRMFHLLHLAWKKNQAIYVRVMKAAQ